MNLSYEDAKELMQNGFPQTGKGHLEGVPTSNETAEVCYFPTLRQLIDACGENIGTIDFLHDQNKVIAYGYSGLKGEGISPEQAVKNLWCALNKK